MKRDWKDEQSIIYDVITLLRERSSLKTELKELDDRTLLRGAANMMENMIRDLLD